MTSRGAASILKVLNQENDVHTSSLGKQAKALVPICFEKQQLNFPILKWFSMHTLERILATKIGQNHKQVVKSHLSSVHSTKNEICNHP